MVMNCWRWWPSREPHAARDATIAAMTLPAHELRRLRAVAGDDPDRFAALVKARLGGEPLQYLEGTAPFGPLDLVVDHRVLIPRPETERLWELARGLVDHPQVIVDLCTGSGALALALKLVFPAARVLATELSPGAVAVARANATRLDLVVEILEGDLFEPLPEELAGTVDLVVSNPPYVAEGEWSGLPADVKREPAMALVAGPDGSEMLARIAGEVGGWLRPGGMVACEMGETQGKVVRALLGGLDEVRIHQDLAGRDRFVTGRRGRIADPSD
jgi:release factor glutamine methyltransferase